MPCLLALFALALPRLVLILVWLFGSGYLGRAYQSVLWPLLGFFFLPLTTLAYAFAMNSNGGNVNGGYLVLLIFAVLIDLGIIGGGAKGNADVVPIDTTMIAHRLHLVGGKSRR